MAPDIADTGQPNSQVVRRLASRVFNFDVLCHIMSFLESREIIAMTCTCYVLCSIGVKALINNTPSLFRRNQLRSFCRFMLADAPRRFRSLRTIELYLISIKPSDAKTVDPLVDVLSQAMYLERM
ncbi:hypothetical protein OBBRIDRAFT_190110 [Obba rivulosa]|uniref:F-box domain-containing protein n=1 Tax=Obba rivulosa TaxID=1052685 RepID=A0A8E2AR99_9APHY|nr:hypothetical protein OBBRIDRAFT_190110 [Obba rivulosa]